MFASILGGSIQDFIERYPKAYAIAGCLLCSGAYVGVLILRKSSREMSRDHPDAIKDRMIGVACVCRAAWLPLYMALPKVLICQNKFQSLFSKKSGNHF